MTRNAEEMDISPDDIYSIGSKNVVGQDGKNHMIHAFACFGKYNADSEKDPDEEVDTRKWIDCTNSLPSEIEKNIHSSQNVVLKFLGLQKW